MENQCQKILDNTRQQCSRVGYATAVIDDTHGELPFCRLHFSQLMAQPEVFAREHNVICANDRTNFDSLMKFFTKVHEEVKAKEIT